jgi:D-apionolactonase
MTLSRPVLYYGKEDLIPDPLPLRAGPLSLMYENGDLRSIRLGGQEVLRRVYVAIRDRNWGTIAPVFSEVEMRIEEDRFTIRFAVENRAGEIDFAWHGEIRGEADGTITFRMDGAAHATFWKNRIGFCVLHPASLSGQAAVVEHVDGTLAETHFPEEICADQPVQPFANLRAIRHPVIPRVWAEVQMTGDVFEMEDQRLWTDASFKTFCTPLSLPYPAEIQAGTKVAQSITLRLLDTRPEMPFVAANGTAARDLEPVRLSLGDAWTPVPPLGLALASHGKGLSEREAQGLRALHLNHLRVELALADPRYPSHLREGMEQSAVLGIPLELALRVTTGAGQEEISAFRKVLGSLCPRVCGYLISPASEPYSGGNPSGEIARAAWQILKSYDPAIPLAVGTNTDFIFLKRTTPPLEWMDQVCITLNPQAHAFDNQSLVETLEAQPMLIDSARRFAKGRPVVVSPVTLKPCYNPYASGPARAPSPGELPPQVDPRQMSLFGAGWTLGSLRAMVAAGAARMTYYETTGSRGVMETEEGSPPNRVSRSFPSLPGCVFPMYFVFALYGEYSGGEAAVLTSSDGLCVSGLALRKNGKTCILLANHTGQVQHVRLAGVTGVCHARCLDETNAEAAMRAPEDFLREAGEAIRLNSEGIDLEVNPFGISISISGHDGTGRRC